MAIHSLKYILACFYLSRAAIASIEFTIATGPCDDGSGLYNQCDDSAAGGLCASTPDVTKKWCCPPEAAQCGTWGETCTGTGNLAGPGQIYCQSSDGTQKWCCNAKYDACIADDDAFNLCRTQFANPYANTTEEEALSLKSAFLSTATSSSTTDSATSTAAISTTSTSPAVASASSTGSSTSARPSSSTASDSSHTGLGGGAIAGIVIGAVAGIAALALLAFFLLRQHRKNRALRQQLDAVSAAQAQVQQAPAYSPAPWPQIHELDPKAQVSEMGPGGRY